MQYCNKGYKENRQKKKGYSISKAVISKSWATARRLSKPACSTAGAGVIFFILKEIILH